MRGRRERLLAALLVFGVALALRGLHIWQIRRAPFFDLELGDAAAYDAWARRIVGCATVVAAVAVFCNLPLVPKNKLEAATRYNDGVGLEANNRQDEAIREYQAAVELDPGLAAARNDLGLLLGKRGRLAEATVELGEAVRLSPGFAKAQNNLGVRRFARRRIGPTCTTIWVRCWRSRAI